MMSLIMMSIVIDTMRILKVKMIIMIRSMMIPTIVAMITSIMFRVVLKIMLLMPKITHVEDIYQYRRDKQCDILPTMGTGQ